MQFSKMLDDIKVDQPEWKELTSMKDAFAFANKVKYPVLVRPSYVLSGAAMNVVNTDADLEALLRRAADVSPEHPVVMTKFLLGAKEIECDAVCKDGLMVNWAISEHVEFAGVHSGDATLMFPTPNLSQSEKARFHEVSQKIARALKVTGPVNIQVMKKMMPSVFG
jgi:carbamoyl-phosphate synthase/aspartate carbamoyltransferase